MYVKWLDPLINQNHRHQQNHSLSQRSICLFNYPSHWVAKENLQGFKATWVWRKWRVVVTQQVEWGVVGGADKGHFLASSGQWEELCPVVFILHYELMLHCPHSAKKDLSINVISFITTESTNFLFQNLFIDGVGGRKYHAHIDVFDIIVHIFQICFLMNVLRISFPWMCMKYNLTCNW